MPFVKIAKTCSAPLNKMIARAEEKSSWIKTYKIDEYENFLVSLVGKDCINPLYTNGLFLLVWYNNLGIVHCTYLEVSGYI